ncbi:ABC-type branched-chain amino acid transport system, substrate-binding protein [Paracoccus isoporae]|uniref:ABC-type branched-chain amino acid transport system, substrate-binding protein n=1 Tax=Paracoccus isoporae TaxID=591205 RepID=A0A1G7GN06_9RHOB|nr:penicillin-binding protein activator [Paracoccus isoporae]SDE89558.1 ABC-type branched-chain amino acid transport system, substrate-binding protein [Paracoccus isoporae]
MFTIAKRITRRAALAVFAAGMAVSACQPTSLGSSGPAIGPQIDPSAPVQVALLVPGETGNNDLDWLGRSLANSARMAAADANGAEIDLRVYTTSPTESSAVEAAERAAAEGAKIILGPLFADSANAVGNAMKDNNLNVLSFSNNTEIAGGNVYVLGNTFQNVADRLVGYGVQQGLRRFLMVYENDAAGQIGAAAIQSAIAQNGATLSGRQQHALSQESIDAIIPAVTQAAKGDQIDAIFMTANQQAVLPYLTSQLNAAGVTSREAQLMGLTRWDIPAARLQLPGVQGGWFALPDSSMQQQFTQRYRSAYGEAPHELGSLGYDGVAAIAALAGSGNRNAVNTIGLTRPAGFTGVNGVFRLRRNGTNERGMAVATINDGRVVVIDPAPRSFGRGFGF